MDREVWHRWKWRTAFLLLLICIPIAFHLLVRAPEEPVFNGDSNRHVMTSVFFHDFLTDLPLSHPRSYAEDYYEQYPALGLLIWPPLFHFTSGCLMLAAGISDWVPRALVWFSCACSVFLMHRLAKRHGRGDEGLIAGILFSLLPLAFTYSRYVMLEMPTLCLCLWCIERFDLWLTNNKARTLCVAAMAASFAALTRFDAIVLLPTLLLMAAISGKFRQLFSWATFAATAVAVVLVGPTYAVIWDVMGDLHVRQATESVAGYSGQIFAPRCWTFYPSCLPQQAGWAVVVLSVVGLIAAFRRDRFASIPFAALWLGTYCSFTPLAELSSRHSIYWLPAVSWFAVLGLLCVIRAICRITSCRGAVQSEGLLLRKTWTSAIAVLAFLIATGMGVLDLPERRVRGYAQAANVALNLTEPGETLFIDSWWEGNLIYQFRRIDSQRQRSVVRANRLLYDFTSIPDVDLTNHVHSDAEILTAIAETAPSCVAIEFPQPFGNIPMAGRLRTLVAEHPDAFPIVKRIPVEVDFPGAREFAIHVFDVNLNQLKQLAAQYEQPDTMTSATLENDSTSSDPQNSKS